MLQKLGEGNPTTAKRSVAYSQRGSWHSTRPSKPRLPRETFFVRAKSCCGPACAP